MGYKMNKPEMFNGSSFVNSKSPSIELSGPLNLRDTYKDAYTKSQKDGSSKKGETQEQYTVRAKAWNADPKNKTKTAKYKREQAAKKANAANTSTDTKLKTTDLSKGLANDNKNTKGNINDVNPTTNNKTVKEVAGTTPTDTKKGYGKENYKDEDYKRTVDADGTKGSYKEKRQKDKAVNLDNKIEKKANKLKTLNSDTEAGGKKFNKKGKKRNAAGRVGNWLKRGLTKGSKKRTENRADKLRGKIDARDDADMKSKLGDTSTTKSQVDGKGKNASTKKEKKATNDVANNNRHNALMGMFNSLES
jgi:hypothetical protein